MFNHKKETIMKRDYFTSEIGFIGSPFMEDVTFVCLGIATVVIPIALLIYVYFQL